MGGAHGDALSRGIRANVNGLHISLKSGADGLEWVAESGASRRMANKALKKLYGALGSKSFLTKLSGKVTKSIEHITSNIGKQVLSKKRQVRRVKTNAKTSATEVRWL